MKQERRALNIMTFEEGYTRLKYYVEENHHAQVPYAFVDKDGVALGKWVSRQRDVYHAGKLPVEKIAALNDLGFVWRVDHKAAQQRMAETHFNEFYKHLEAFRKEFGHCDVAQTYTSPDGYKLGAVVNKKRIRPERMTRNQIRKLKDLGFQFSSENKPWSRTQTLKPVENKALIEKVSYTISELQHACIGMPVVAVISSDHYFHAFFSKDEVGTAVIVARAVYEYIKKGRQPIMDMVDAIFGDKTIDMVARMKKSVVSGPYNSSIYYDQWKLTRDTHDPEEWKRQRKLCMSVANDSQKQQYIATFRHESKIIAAVTEDPILKKDNVSVICSAFPLTMDGCLMGEEVNEPDRELLMCRLVAAYIAAYRMEVEKRYEDRWLGSFQKATFAVSKLGMLRNMVNRLIAKGETNAQIYQYAQNY